MESKKLKYNLSYENRQKLGVLLLLNSPKKMQFGIDLSQWVIGDKFMGIKLIPLGIHYISFSLSEENNSFKQGFFIKITSEKKNIIREWNSKHETFIKLNEENEKNYSIGINNLDFDKYLGNYPYEQINNWNDLTDFLGLNADIINKLQKNLNNILCPNFINNEENNDKINDEIISCENIDFTEIYLNQPEYINSLDKSILLEKIIKKNYKNSDELLAEFQYSFVLFLIGEVYEALKQWKNIFILISSSEKLLLNDKNYEKFFCDFIEIIYNQLRLFPDDLMYDVILQNNFLKRYLTNFLLFENNEKKFKKRQNLLKNFVEEKFGYKIKSEEERIIENYKNKLNKEKDKINYDELYKDDINDDLPIIVDENDNFKI